MLKLMNRFILSKKDDIVTDLNTKIGQIVDEGKKFEVGKSRGGL
jgi:hypothetical protein